MFRDGVLCILRQHLIHVLSVHDASRQELVINLQAILRSWTEKQKGQVKFKLVYYQESILTVGVALGQTRRLVVFDTTSGMAPEQRYLASLSPPQSKEMLLRNNGTHILIGLRGLQGKNNNGWFFYLQNISRTAQRQAKPVEFCTTAYFATTDIRTTIAAEIIDGCFWIMTSEVTRDPEGRDPVSYYAGYRWSLDLPNTQPEYWRFCRRRQNEGPIHDLWTNLSLAKDEMGRYAIVEARREWLVKHPEHPLRSFYTLNFSPAEFSCHYSQDENLQAELDCKKEKLQDDEDEEVDTLLEALPSQLWATTESAWLVLQQICQREFPSKRDEYSSPPPPSIPTYTAPNTPYHYYDAPTETFVDLVNDPEVALTSSRANLRLRTGHNGAAIRHWPPKTSTALPACIKALLQPSSLRSFKAFHDERCLVFGSCVGRDSPIVLLSFDASLDFRTDVTQESPTLFGRRSPDNQMYSAPIGEYPAFWTREVTWNRPRPFEIESM